MTNKNYPLSSPQREIWFDQMLHPDVPLYNIGGYVQIDGMIEPFVFEQALQQVIQENDALRIIIQQEHYAQTQTILEKFNFQLNFQNFSSKNDPQQYAIDWMQQKFLKPFQFYEQPLFQFALFKIADNSYYWFKKYHHIIIDGWGISLIVHRVATAYSNLMTGEILPRKSYSYSKFVEADIKYLNSAKYHQHQRYWNNYHFSEPFLIDRHTNQPKTIHSPRSVLTIKRSFYNQLIDFAKTTSILNSTSVFHIILGVLYCYFVKTQNREDFTIGISVLNRSNSAFKQTVGLFTTAIPVCFDFGTTNNFIDLIIQIKLELRKGYRNQRFPPSEINVGGRKFNLAIAYAKHDHDIDFNGNHAKATYLNNIFYPQREALSIFVEEFHLQDDVNIYFDYNLNFFSKEEIERLKSRVDFLLKEVLVKPDIPIWQLQMMPDTELHKLLVEFNDTKIDYPQDKTIVDLFEDQVEKTPDNIAVVFENEQLTYRELNNKANQLAHYLQKLGVKPEVLVGIFIERSLEMIIGLLGVLKAGGAYLPLDPAYPIARIEFMLEDAQTTTLLIQAKLIERLPPCRARVLHLDTDWSIISQCSNTNLPSIAQPHNLAYVIYTSGSTGNPKGVEVIHNGLCNLSQTQIKLFNVQSDSRILQFAPFSFDASISEIVMSIASGACLYLEKLNNLSSSLKLTQLLQKNNITHVTLPPTELTNLSKELIKIELNLQYIIVAGESCPLKLAEQWAKEKHFFNAYGPTETTVCATVFQYIKKQNYLPIGRPIANTQIYILDKHLQPVPIGTPGELHIGGAGLARGYLNRPKLTAEKFIPNPFSKEPNSRLYKTGDLARYLPDGNIEYLGRIDHQVKIRGFRIELGEIETILMQHHNVKEVVVIAKQEKNDKRLSAYIVSDLTIDRTPCQTECLVEIGREQFSLQTNDLSCSGISISGISCSEGTKLKIKLPKQTNWLDGEVAWCEKEQIGVELQHDTQERDVMKNICNDIAKETGLLDVLQRSLASNLRKHVRERLPDYMMPGAFVLLDSIPLTPNGKIDRQALAELSVDGKQLFTKEFIAPRTPEEELLANIWKDVLNVKRVGIQDNFFELGGHSLLVMQLMSKITDTFAVDIPLKQIFDSPTVTGMIEVINGTHASKTETAFDLDAEAVLDPSIQLASLPVTKSIDSVFLTGATGFLGSYLLYELLVQTTADIYCLIYSGDKNILVDKLKSNISWDESFTTRIILVHGDLSKPLLGLEKEYFKQLASKIDVIYHNGAWVTHIYPYSVLKTTNVLGTEEILRLASEYKVKPVHFISALYSSIDGYARSKIVSEKLVKLAGERGLPAWIYRPYNICWHSKTGVFNWNDTFSLMLKGCIQLGKMPSIENAMANMTPVDCVSNTIVELSLQQHQPKDFNLMNPHNTSLNDLFTKLRSLGYALECIPYKQWRSELSEQTENVLYPMLSALPEEEKLSTMHTISSEHKHDEFIGADWPIIDDKMLDTYFAYFRESGFVNDLETPVITT